MKTEVARMNALITGGAGFIGSHLTNALLASNHCVVCVDNLCLGSIDLIKHHFDNKNFSFYEIDICDKEKLDTVLAAHKIDRIYHLAANSDIRSGGNNPAIDFQNTFLTTINTLDAMRKYSVLELMFASSSAVYGDKKELLKEDTGDLRPVSYYGGAKLASEAFISAYAAMNNFKICVIRFPNVVGPGLTHGAIYDFIAKLKKDPARLEILGDGKQEKPYIYVSDLIDAMLSITYQEGMAVVNVGVESASTVRTIADIVCDEMGLGDVEYCFTGGSGGWPGDVPKFQYDLSRIHSLGWRAKHTSDEAVRLAARKALGR